MKKFLVLARKENIRLVSLDADKNIDFRLNIDKQYTRSVHDVVYDVEFQRVYWTDSGCTGTIDNIQDCSQTGGINSIFLNGTGKSSRISLFQGSYMPGKSRRKFSHGKSGDFFLSMEKIDLTEKVREKTFFYW